MKDIVFVIQETERNIGLARKFGDLNVLLTTKEAMLYDDVARKVRMRLDNNNYAPNLDYILCVGDPIAMGIALAEVISMARNMSEPFIKVLKWDRVKMNYDMVSVAV